MENNGSLFMPILLGSARAGRRSEMAARYVLGEAKADGQFETDLIDVRNYLDRSVTAGMAEDKSKKWSKTMSRADGLIIVSPEYNHGYPGELKLMLDEIYEEYHRKPAAICGVSGGGIGGARMVEVLRISLIELQMVPIRNAVYFSNVKNLFDQSGKIHEPEVYTGRLKTMFDELVWYAQALKAARRQVTPKADILRLK